MKYVSRALAIAALLTTGSVTAEMNRQMSDSEFQQHCKELEKEFEKMHKEIDSNKNLKPVLHEIVRMLEHTKMKVMCIKHHMHKCPCMQGDTSRCHSENFGRFCKTHCKKQHTHKHSQMKNYEAE